jgi:hypothetical protein
VVCSFLPPFHLGVYSTLASALSALTSPKVPFKWSPAADWAFSDLKHQFTTTPILIQPDPSHLLVVEVDVSDIGVGEEGRHWLEGAVD